MSEIKQTKPEVKEVDVDELNEYVFDISDEPTTYTLECYKNKERPIEKQMRVMIEPLSAKESNEITKAAFAATGQKNKMGESEWTGKYSTNYTRIAFDKKIKKLENIYFRKDGIIKECTDPLELWITKDRRAEVIVAEIQKIISSQDEITEDEEKN